MTVEDLLTMSPGFECSHQPVNDLTTQQVMATPDWVQATLDLPMTHAPRTRWVYGVLDKLLDSYILPAVQTDEPVPANPDGLALLTTRIDEATTPPPVGPLPPLPDRALDVSGRTIVLEGNPIGLETMTLTFGEGEAEALLVVGFQGGFGLEWAIGLDAVPRISPGLYGIPLAATGAWEPDDVFVVNLDHLGNRDKERLRATFSEGQVDLTGFDVPLVGHLEGQ